MTISQKVENAANAKPADIDITGLRFLIAEDHDFQRNALMKMLERLGAHSVYQVTDGHAALKILQDPACPVDIVISDLDMPGMDGMEFVRHLGETGVRVSIILASALERKLLASISIMAEAYGINLLGAVEKPLTPAKLVPLIRRHRATPASADPPADLKFTLDEIAAGLKNDEFEPFFQPKMTLATGEINGAEALARWRRSGQDVVMPRAFLTMLEDNGLMDELTCVMLKKAAGFCGIWRATGVDATVSVNLSVKTLSDVDIAERLTQLVRNENLDPRHMILEVTESAATTEVGKVLESLARLRMKGFGLSIDDYGTGYSSMQQLTRIAFTELKIDQAFVTHADQQNSARVILESNIEMAKKLNVKSVAEGVETRAGFDLLCKLRCDMAQGYYIARPMAHTAYLRWCLDRQASPASR